MARGDVLWVQLPQTSSREQAGRRPAVAVQSDNSTGLPTLMVVPTTTQVKALRFPYTIEVQASPTNGFTQDSVLLVFQLRAIDRRRIIKTVGQLEPDHLDQLDEEIRNLLGL